MINRVVLVGRITRDPEVQQTNGGISYVRFSLACDRPFKNQNGEKSTDFINCIAWRQQADFMKAYIKKGNMVGVDGRIQVTTYQDQNGNNRQVFDIYVESVANLEPRRNDGFQPTPPFESGFQPSGQNSFNVGNSQPKNSVQEEPEDSLEYEVVEDDLPF